MVALTLLLPLTPTLADTPPCKKIRFSDVGWTDITATTSLASIVLKAMGYEPKTYLLALPVTFTSMKNNDIDVFLGLWMPTMTADITPYLKEKSIELIRTNLEGAKYTLAVPKYVYEAGVKSFADLQKFGSQFNKEIYGIEAGNDGNRQIIEMINKNAFGLGKWSIRESSEQGMLGQVKRAVKRKKWIVFLGWEPHPMNADIDMNYLSGGDDYFGPNYGGAIVQTLVRKGYIQECPNVGTFIKNLSFTLQMENEVMGMILNQSMHHEKAANQWLKHHPEILKKWLDGVTTIDGKPALPEVNQSLGIE
ncbi:MAG: choline ABC transporter substrate-binding protein [Candidatus Magnetomorum sp.]|nr:choline ABC transporter substrate-binding protein [Candidatus Magnetomorum sp.]